MKEYKLKTLSIALTDDHMLPIFQSQFPNYDRFLPHLANFLKPNEGTIVDVGANCGDTLAALVESNPFLSYISIEGDESFYEVLLLNLARIREKFSSCNIITIRQLVGLEVSSALLEGIGGTKSAKIVECNQSMQSLTLDAILENLNCKKVRLLKSDVDGFDFDILNSAKKVLLRELPLVYFECFYLQEWQKIGYIQQIHLLYESGYIDWIIFDNFGSVVMRTENIECLFQLMEYIWNQNIGKASRTIHYFDILAAQKGDTALINTVLAGY